MWEIEKHDLGVIKMNRVIEKLDFNLEVVKSVVAWYGWNEWLINRANQVIKVKIKSNSFLSAKLVNLYIKYMRNSSKKTQNKYD